MEFLERGEGDAVDLFEDVVKAPETLLSHSLRIFKVLACTLLKHLNTPRLIILEILLIAI